ncbi:MAG TPA: SDR family oxidoreductase, partial [Daejeonella sp.]|nr:SDR family oxidoreductase [Daejeonella sp.]
RFLLDQKPVQNIMKSLLKPTGVFLNTIILSPKTSYYCGSINTMNTLSNRWNLNGKRCVITGASKGIGRAIAWEFLNLGAEVFIISRKEDELQTVINEWKQQNFKIDGVAADVSKASERERIAQAIQEKWGGLDVLVNNAGTNIRKKTAEYSAEEYHFLMQTNLDSAYHLCQLFYPLLQKSAQGNIISITSVAGLNHLRTGSVYGMTKAALVQLSKNLACEWAADNIRVNAIAPWYIETPLAETVLQNPDFLQEVLNRTPIKKIGQPEDVAAAAAFLCMPAAAHITGQCLAVDGGFSVYGF